MSNSENTSATESTKDELFTDIIYKLPVHPTKKPKKQNKIKKIVVHTTDGVVTPQGLAKYDIGPNHISKTGCPSVTYHYLINQSGKAGKCCPHEVVTWHAGPHNNQSLAVAFNYKTDAGWEKAAVQGVATEKPPNSDNKPSQAATITLLRLLEHLCLTEGVHPTEVYGHRELKGTGWFMFKGSRKLRKTCPGMSVDMKWIRDSTIKNVQRSLKQKGLYGGAIDGDWGPKSKAAFKVYLGLQKS